MALFAPALQQFFDNNGNPLAGGKVYTYEAGTTTNKVTYTSEDESTANTNPVILDAGGRANIWLDSGSYKLVFNDADDVLITQIDDITGAAANVFGSSVVDLAVNTNISSVYQNNVIRTTATPITLTLLPAATAGQGFLFSVKNTSAGANTIDPDASELIDGGATLTLGAGASTLIVCDGAGWTSLFIADDILPLDNTFTGANTFTGVNTFTGNNDFQGADTFSGDVTFTGAVSFADDGELTIASGSITPTGVYHRVDTEADASTDDLDTITAGASGQKLLLRAESDARDVVIKHNTGNIVTSDEADITLGTDKKIASFVYDATLSLWVSSSQPASQPIFTDSFNSGNLTISANATTTATHGLGGVPSLVMAELVCTTIDSNFAVGDRIVFSLYTDNGGVQSGYTVISNATTCRICVNDRILLTDPVSFGAFVLTLTRWRVNFRAWL